ncbi:MAG: amidohydrolase family protein [Clostridia bacterium]|nr:amidohydrolase family protein [Clostridia bacterium]
MIIDTHSHLNTSTNGFYFFNGLSISNFVSSYPDDYKAIVCLNPKISEFSCPNDCTQHCGYYSKNFNVEKCKKGCLYENIHPVSTVDSSSNSLTLQCLKCGTIIYKGEDPLRKYNIALLKQTTNFPNTLYPMIYLNISNNTIANEIQFYEKNYPIVGYKIHPQTNYRSIDDLDDIPTELPILVHTGIGKYDHPKFAIEFSKRHKGIVILAHACRLDIDSLKAVNDSPNLYLDVCPSHMLFNSKDFAIAAPIRESIQSPQDIYKTVLKYVSIDKILFGSDYAWGLPKAELAIVQSLPISDKDKEKILYRNAINVYKL